jgi:hypothetical protein
MLPCDPDVEAVVKAVSVKEVRQILDQLIRERGEDYASLSRLIGRNPSYIQQFIKRGTPKRLNEDDRSILAQHLGVDEVTLGGRSQAEPNLKRVAGPKGHERACRRVARVQSEQLLHFFRSAARCSRHVIPTDMPDLFILRIQDETSAQMLGDDGLLCGFRYAEAAHLLDGVSCFVIGLDIRRRVRRSKSIPLSAT